MLGFNFPCGPSSQGPQFMANIERWSVINSIQGKPWLVVPLYCQAYSDENCQGSLASGHHKGPTISQQIGN